MNLRWGNKRFERFPFELLCIGRLPYDPLALEILYLLLQLLEDTMFCVDMVIAWIATPQALRYAHA
jgi:hypothetical protein